MENKLMTSKELKEFGQTVAAGFAAGIEKSKMPMMKVFKMNDYDWVAAKNEEEAKNFYEEFIDREEIEEDFVGEVSLQDKMHISIDELPDEEQRVATIEPVIHRGGETCVLRSFEWVIKRDNITNPCIIASTEY